MPLKKEKFGSRGSPVRVIGEPYHGYFYKILTGQGKDAPGGAYDYVVNGQMIGDLRDTTADLPIAGWTGGIEAQGTETQETITVTKFEERDFSH